jgi:hypothetical protein
MYHIDAVCNIDGSLQLPMILSDIERGNRMNGKRVVHLCKGQTTIWISFVININVPAIIYGNTTPYQTIWWV